MQTNWLVGVTDANIDLTHKLINVFFIFGERELIHLRPVPAPAGGGQRGHPRLRATAPSSYARMPNTWGRSCPTAWVMVVRMLSVRERSPRFF